MIPAINEQTGEFKNIEEVDILFLIVKKGTTYFHTYTGTYRRIKGSEEFSIVFAPLGFTQVDRNTLAQMDLITRYDPLMRIAYFDSPNHPAQACFVTSDIGRELSKRLHKWKDGRLP